MWPKILLGAYLLLKYPSRSLVTVATGYKQWTVVTLLLPTTSGLGFHPSPFKVRGLGH